MSTTTLPDAGLYDRDFALWAETQAGRLREAARTSNLPIDWENLAAELEGLSNSQQAELGSRLTTILEHLLKLRHSSAQLPRRGWRVTVVTQRHDLARLLRLSPSLRRRLSEQLPEAYEAARQRAQTGKPPGERWSRVPETCPFAVEQILDPNWFPARSSV
ncbi:DUF29 domain-containing protein [Geminicoccus harenae]|uniref:DUF29 domain-containing protein n=1 Tax=Geminicoccus harenae TaxID=2498453 RepID=UPI001C938A52|nr:DUF29 domain-containing protein [Geminicoccus harenae]